ncbi:MAG: hypothetical protein ACRC5C_10000 [Bacilli bacterium]
MDKMYADLGDVLTFTLSLKNQGNVSATEVVLSDVLDPSLTFISGTLNSSVPLLDENFAHLVLANPVVPGETILLSWQCRVTSVPLSNPVPNEASVVYAFEVDPQTGQKETGSGYSNRTETYVHHADVQCAKAVGSNYADVDEAIRYTLTLTNVGNIVATDVVVRDNLQAAHFIPGTLTVSVPYTGTDPTVGGVHIVQILPSETITITFEARTDVIPLVNPIRNEATVDYVYHVDPRIPDVKTGHTVSNAVFTTIVSALCVVTKTVDQDYAYVGDTLHYRVEVHNEGNASATNVVIQDMLQSALRYIPSSLYTSSPVVGDDWRTGYSIVNPIEPGETFVASFAVEVIDLPASGVVENAAHARWTYTVDPMHRDDRSRSADSNVVTTTIRAAILFGRDNFIKTVDREFADYQDVLTYTLRMTNVGNTAAIHVYVQDTLPAQLEFVPGSLAVNVPFSGTSLDSGIVLLNPITVNETVEMTCKAVVKARGPRDTLRNVAHVRYDFYVDPGETRLVTLSGPSTEAVTYLRYALVTVRKSATADTVDLYSTLGYELHLVNYGNMPATNVTLTDVIPSEMTFVPGTLHVSVPYMGDSLETGITLLQPMAPMDSVTVTFDVTATTYPNGETVANFAESIFNYSPNGTPADERRGIRLSNVVHTLILYADLTTAGNIVKAVDIEEAVIGDVLTYTLNLHNTGNVSARRVTITDPAPLATEWISGSESASVPFTGNMETELILNNPIEPDGRVTVRFQARVVAIPPFEVIENQAFVRYWFNDTPVTPVVPFAARMSTFDVEPGYIDAQSNIVETVVSEASFHGPGDAVKLVDRTSATLNEPITYTIRLRNSGNLPAENVRFVDDLPMGAVVDEGSLVVSVPYTGSLTTGIAFTAPIASQQAVTVRFTVRALQIPPNNELVNRGTVYYEYVINGERKSDFAHTNTVITPIRIAILDAPGVFIKTVDRTVATIGDVLTYSVTTRNIGNTAAKNVRFVDPIPSYTALVPNSIRVNVPFSGDLFTDGCTLLNPVVPGEVISIEFQVRTLIPIVNPSIVRNAATVSYAYDTDARLRRTVLVEGQTNVVETQIVWADLISGDNFTKVVDVAYATVGDVLTYTLTIHNSGSIAAENIVLTDPLDGSVLWISNSLTCSVPYSGTDFTTGIRLLSPIVPGGTVVLTYAVQIERLPDDNPLSNVAYIAYTFTVPGVTQPVAVEGSSTHADTFVYDPSFQLQGSFVKHVDRKCVNPQELLTYTLRLRNQGNVAASAVVMTDQVQFPLKEWVGSVNVSVPFAGDSLQGGIHLLQPVLPNETVVLSFVVRAEEVKETMVVINTATVQYDVVFPPNTLPTERRTEESNGVVTRVQPSNSPCLPTPCPDPETGC